MMRGINTTVRRLRRKVFEEVAALGFKADADTLCDDMEAIPYALVNDETEQYRDSVYRARAVVREQVRLAMGLALRPEDKPVHLTAGVEASNISDKYYEPPLMQVIPSACMRCEAKGYEVSNMCKGCLAHPCMEVCPKGAISMVNGNPTLIRKNVSNVENVRASVHMTQSPRKSALVQKPVVSMRLKTIKWGVHMSIRTNAYPAVCVW